jgi:transcriptional regulator with XRE-family HTH domain
MKIETYLIVGAELVDKHERFQERRNCITNTWELFHKENCFSAEQMKFENMFLSPAELECLLQAAELLMDEGNFQQAERLLNKLWEYRNHHQQDENEQVKIYPYIAWQLALCKKCQNKKIDFQLVERAMELSIRAGKLYGVVPLMEILLEDRDWAGDREQLKMQHNALIECGRLADANLYSIYPMFSIEGMFLVNEVVRKKRIERKITQEQLCEEIMSQNWYSKFENGAFTTRWFTTELLLMELELPFQRQWLKLDTDDAKAFRLQQMCYKNIHQFQYELMDEHYMSLRRMIDMNSIINQQFCEYMDIIVAEAVLKQVDLKKRNAQAMKSLKRTVKNFSEKDLDRELFSELEKRLINSYACSMDNKYRTTDLLHKIIKNTYNTEEFIDYPSSYQYTLEMNYWIHVAITERLNKTIKPKIKCAQRLLRSGISEELVYVITTILADIHEAFPKSPNSAYICRIWYNYVLYIAQLTRTIAGIVYAQNFGDDIS